MTETKVKKISIGEVKRLNKEKGLFWFTQDTMKFFDSRIETNIVKVVKNKGYFITSEQFHDSGGSEPRKYTIRVVDLDTGRVNTVIDFNTIRAFEVAKDKLDEIIKELVK